MLDKHSIVRWIEKWFGCKICVIYARMREYTSAKGMSKECPFCSPREIVREGQHWLVIRNAYPYPRTQDHLLIISRAHIKVYGEIEIDTSAELFRVLEEYLAQGYVMFGRQYPMADASVEHLHIHLIRQG